jgi:hypothetical protein
MRIYYNNAKTRNNNINSNRGIKVYSRNVKSRLNENNNNHKINEYNKISSGTLTESFPELNNEETQTIKRFLVDHDNQFKYTFKNYQNKHKKAVTLLNTLTYHKKIPSTKLTLNNNLTNLFSNKMINSRLDNYQQLSITNNVIRFKNNVPKKSLISDVDVLKEIKNESTSNFNNKYDINFSNKNKLKREYISNLMNKFKKGHSVDELMNQIKNRKFKFYISSYNYIPEFKLNNLIKSNEHNFINELLTTKTENNKNKVRIKSLKITRPLSNVIHYNKISYVL